MPVLMASVDDRRHPLLPHACAALLLAAALPTAWARQAATAEPSALQRREARLVLD